MTVRLRVAPGNHAAVVVVVALACAGDGDSGKPTPCPSLADGATGLREYLQHISDHTCLAAADAPGLRAAMQERYDVVALPCHTVWRTYSPDGVRWDDSEERVLDHTSVPDAWIDASGTHWLTGNDVTPFRLVEVATEQPERLPREGMLGMGGMVLARGSGASADFERVTSLDLALPRPLMFADPDLRQTASGEWQLVWLRTDPQNLAEIVNPALAADPHEIVRSRSGDGIAFEPAEWILEPSLSNVVDPTAGPDGAGGVVIYASQGLDDTFGLWEWRWTEGASPAAEGTRVATFDGVTPDLVVREDGSQRLVVMVPDVQPIRFYQRASGAAVWEPWSVDNVPAELRNPSLAEDPSGGWWLYYNRTDAACLAEVRG